MHKLIRAPVRTRHLAHSKAGGLLYKQSDPNYALVLFAAWVPLSSAPYTKRSFEVPMPFYIKIRNKGMNPSIDSRQQNQRKKKKFNKPRNKTCTT